MRVVWNGMGNVKRVPVTEVVGIGQTMEHNVVVVIGRKQHSSSHRTGIGTASGTLVCRTGCRGVDGPVPQPLLMKLPSCPTTAQTVNRFSIAVHRPLLRTSRTQKM